MTNVLLKWDRVTFQTLFPCFIAKQGSHIEGYRKVEVDLLQQWWNNQDLNYAPKKPFPEKNGDWEMINVNHIHHFTVFIHISSNTKKCGKSQHDRAFYRCTYAYYILFFSVQKVSEHTKKSKLRISATIGLYYFFRGNGDQFERKIKSRFG